MLLFGYSPRDLPMTDLEPNYAWPVGWVTTRVQPDSWSIVNQTTPDHMLDPGSVTRQIVQEGHDFYIETTGYGAGVAANMNSFLAPAVWQGVDYALIRRAGVNRTSP